MFSLAYYGMLRASEFTSHQHTIKACDIHVGHNKDKIMLVLYSSKTHGAESGPQKIKISAAATKSKIRSQKFFCPFKLVIHFMKLRGSYLSTKEAFFVFRDRNPVQASQFRTVLRSLLTRINLDGTLYDIHSFRSGRTSDLEKFGYSIDQIKAMGRWKSNAVYRYLKNWGIQFKWEFTNAYLATSTSL